MKIINQKAGTLSDVEVYWLLQDKVRGRNPTPFEYHALKHLEMTVHEKLRTDRTAVQRFLEAMDRVVPDKLTKSERMAMLNHQPRALPELFLLVDVAKLSERERTELLQETNAVLGRSPYLCD
eukprot:m51a1_g5984 hypothetical protein (123) ;mRNA; f:258965-259531